MKTPYVEENGVLLQYTGTCSHFRVPEGIREIGAMAFSGNESLVSITLPEGLKAIRSGAFRSCSALEEILIPDSVEELGKRAFLDCRHLRCVCLPELETLEDFLFQDCIRLETVRMQGVHRIGNYTFQGCFALTDVVLPESVRCVETHAFAWCTGLRSCSLPTGLAELGGGAFLNCRSLESVAIPAGVRKLRAFTFLGCTRLESIHLPDGLTDIEERVFEYCPKLGTIPLPRSVSRIHARAFDGHHVIIPADSPYFQRSDPLVLSRDGKTLVFCLPTAGRSLRVPDSVTTVQEYAFCYCRDLTEISFPESITTVGDFDLLANEDVLVMDAPGMSLSRIPRRKILPVVRGFARRYCSGRPTPEPQRSEALAYIREHWRNLVRNPDLLTVVLQEQYLPAEEVPWCLEQVSGLGNPEINAALLVYGHRRLDPQTDGQTGEESEESRECGECAEERTGEEQASP